MGSFYACRMKFLGFGWRAMTKTNRKVVGPIPQFSSNAFFRRYRHQLDKARLLKKNYFHENNPWNLYISCFQTRCFTNALGSEKTWNNIPSAAHWLRGWIFSIQLKPRYEVSRTDTPELEIMYPPDERAEVAAAESQSPLQARLILVRLGFYYIQSIDLFNLQWFTHCMMWNDVQWNLTHRVTERINIFVVYLYIWFRHTARTPAWSGLRCRGSWFFSFSVGSWTTLFLSPCIWHYIFLSASQLLVLLGNWCFLLSIKKCQWEKGYSTQGQKFSWTHLQTFTNILIRYFVNSLSLTFSKDLICVVWEGFMVPVRWLSWLCGSWAYVRVRRLKKKWQSWRTIPLPRDRIYSLPDDDLWWLMRIWWKSKHGVPCFSKTIRSLRCPFAHVGDLA